MISIDTRHNMADEEERELLTSCKGNLMESAFNALLVSTFLLQFNSGREREL